MDEDIFAFDSQYQELLNEDFNCDANPKNNEIIVEHLDSNKIHIDLLSIYLNCKGDFKDYSSLNFNDNIFHQDLENIFNHQHIDFPNDKIELFNFDFDNDFNDYDTLIQMARVNIQKLSLSLLNNVDQEMNITFHTLRADVTKLLLFLRCNYQHLNENQLGTVRTMLGTFDSIPNFSMVHLSYCNDGNSSRSSNYHHLHLMLECRWILLTTVYQVDFFNGRIGSDESELSCEVKLLMYDLVMLSASKFLKHNSSNLVHTSPFICTCVKDLWRLLYLFITKLGEEELEFWTLLSSVLDEIENGKSFYKKYDSKRILLRSSQPISFKNHEIFAIWTVCGIVKLMDKEDVMFNKSSYDLLENLIRKHQKIDQTEEKMRIILMIMADVLLNIWQPKSEVLMILWEYYQRKINSPFLIVGQSPNLMAVSSTTAAAYLEQIRSYQNTQVTKLNYNSSSFNIFVYILGHIVERFSNEGQKIQVQKIFSRIYTKFPPTKLQQLNEMGIHNFLRLLITLSVSGHVNDIGSKVSDTLLQIPMEKPNHQQQIMKGHMTMLILCCENKLNISNYLTKLTNQVNNILQKTNTGVSLLKILSESLSLILLKSLNDYDKVLENGEELLLDSWIIHYFQSSSSAEQDRIYETLTKIIQRVIELVKQPLVCSKVISLKEKLFSLLIPYGKQVFGKIESVWLPEMVANLCLLTSSTKSDNPKFESLFKTFIDLNTTNLEQPMKFLTVILKNSESKTSLDINLIIQNWIKLSVLLSGNNNDLKELTQQIITLKEFKFLCETSETKTEDFLNSKERLCSFIGDIGRKYAASNYQEKFQLIERVHVYFSTFEKWSVPYLQQQPTLQTQNSQQRSLMGVINDESIMRIYSFIAITFLHCSELIYVRSKSSCFFNVAVAHFILPSTLMCGQNPPRSIIISMHKIWPLLIEGISKLNYKCDQNVNKVLNDVVVKWAPLMKISNNSKFVAKPFISISNFKNIEIVELFWGKLAKSFVALQPGRKSNPHVSLILTIFDEVLQILEADETRVMAVWKNMIHQVIESAMLLDEIEPAQKSCISLIDRFVKNRNFENSSKMKDLMMNNLKIITENSLSYHSGLYFRFLGKLLKISKKTVNNFLPSLLTQIQKVEQLRGSGRDVKLRKMYDQLQEHCRKA